MRDNYQCFKCAIVLTENTAHIDHVQSGKNGSNADSNLRPLCRRCHVLRADFRHRGMIARALEDGIIPPNWRELVWE
jgi:5-methylcytosine-specific restriction endonuclease McrA